MMRQKAPRRRPYLRHGGGLKIKVKSFEEMRLEDRSRSGLMNIEGPLSEEKVLPSILEVLKASECVVRSLDAKEAKGDTSDGVSSKKSDQKTHKLEIFGSLDHLFRDT